MSKVLVVDEEDICLMLQIVLGKVVKVATTTSAKTALDTMADYDVLVTDMKLHSPLQMTGVDLARIYKQIRPDGFVVLASGWSDLKSEHVDLHMTKPLDLDRLTSVVKRACKMVA